MKETSLQHPRGVKRGRLVKKMNEWQRSREGERRAEDERLYGP